MGQDKVAYRNSAYLFDWTCPKNLCGWVAPTMGRVAVAMGSELQRLWGLKVSLVLVLVQQIRI